MDVTKEINANYIVYGASDYTAANGNAASKQLNFSIGPSISRPDQQNVSVIPHTFKYEGSVGLFGSENYFTKIQLSIVGDIVKSCFEEEFWSCGTLRPSTLIIDNQFDEAIIDFNSFPIVNQYEEAVANSDRLPYLPGGRGFLSIELTNLKTLNEFKDKDLDIRLYTMDKEEHTFNKMYVQVYDHFYIGFHARNTRILDYNVECTIGAELRSYDSIADKSLIMKRIKSGSF
ncbi:MAG: hypothetical protein CMJ25_15795 [Phycisphaerae bacterium]|nr:hypothetical protein [Phycisphaerae bacterium]|tara:strand:+ start:472 stop:1164 length:693 start_codon:yes stop_codon:yes gene_type:complete